MDTSRSPHTPAHPELIEHAKTFVPAFFSQRDTALPICAGKLCKVLLGELHAEGATDEGAADQAIRQLIDDGMLEAEVPVADESSHSFDRFADMSLGFGPVPMKRIYVKATDLLWESEYNQEESSPPVSG